MRWIAVLVAIAASGCSFVLVDGPSQRVEVVHEDQDCTRSPIVPIIDAAGGIALASIAVGGVVLEQTSSDGKPEHFGLYFAGPLVVGSIIYFLAASRGNERVTWCGDLKERLAAGQQVKEVPLSTFDTDKPAESPSKKPTKPAARQSNDDEDPNKKK